MKSNASPFEFVHPGDEGYELLVKARAGGVVLDYALVSSEESFDDADVVRRAVAFTVRGFCALRELDPGPDIDSSSISGTRIGIEEFYGTLVDLERRRLLLLGFHLRKRDPDRYRRGPNASGLVSVATPWGWSDDPNTPIEVTTIGHVFAYGGAFLHPPYELDLAPEQTHELFFAIDEVILQHPGPQTEIWVFRSRAEEGSAWSLYFEWNFWGGCIWLVRTGDRQVVAIGASAGD